MVNFKSDNNTVLFYKELNGDCDPKKLLDIAKYGICLYEPLFKYDKIKNHANVVNISIIACQYFMINNDEQLKRFCYILSDKDYFDELFEYTSLPLYISTERDCAKLIIPNEYFITKVLNGGLNYESDYKVNHIEIKQEWLFYLYKYNYITRDDFINFYYTGWPLLNLQFFLFEYFYYDNKKYLNNLMEKSSIAFKIEILYYIIIKYLCDINILKYCANIVEKYIDVNISSDVIYKLYKERENNQYLSGICIDKENIFPNRFRFYFIYVKEYFLSSMIDDIEIKENYEQLIYKDIDKFNIYNDKSKNIEYNFINFLLSENDNIQKFKLGYYADCRSILHTNDKYYNSYEFFDKLLKNPNYIFEMDNYDILYNRDRQLILFYYLISLFHNNIYNARIINFLVSTLFSNDLYFYHKFKFFFTCDGENFDQLHTMFEKIPHEDFKKYIEL